MPGLDIMTRCGHLLLMTRVGIAELKARLSRYVALARKGKTVQILDRDTPVALLVPLPDPKPRLRTIRPRKGSRPWYEIQGPPLPPGVGERLFAEFLEERKKER